MVKHTQTIRRLLVEELFVFDHFVGLSLKGLTPLFIYFCKLILLLHLEFDNRFGSIPICMQKDWDCRESVFRIEVQAPER